MFAEKFRKLLGSVRGFFGCRVFCVERGGFWLVVLWGFVVGWGGTDDVVGTGL